MSQEQEQPTWAAFIASVALILLIYAAICHAKPPKSAPLWLPDFPDPSEFLTPEEKHQVQIEHYQRQKKLQKKAKKSG